MIRAVLVLNTQGKPRLAKFYEFRVPTLFKPLPNRFRLRSLDAIFTLNFYAVVDQPVEKQQEIIRNVFAG